MSQSTDPDPFEQAAKAGRLYRDKAAYQEKKRALEEAILEGFPIYREWGPTRVDPLTCFFEEPSYPLRAKTLDEIRTVLESLEKDESVLDRFGASTDHCKRMAFDLLRLTMRRAEVEREQRLEKLNSAPPRQQLGVWRALTDIGRALAAHELLAEGKCSNCWFETDPWSYEAPMCQTCLAEEKAKQPIGLDPKKLPIPAKPFNTFEPTQVAKRPPNDDANGENPKARIGKESIESVADMSDRQKLLLENMLEKGITSLRTRKTRAQIVKATNRSWKENRCNHDFARLSENGYIKTEISPKGGCYLTAKGKAAAEQILSDDNSKASK